MSAAAWIDAGTQSVEATWGAAAGTLLLRRGADGRLWVDTTMARASFEEFDRHARQVATELPNHGIALFFRGEGMGGYKFEVEADNQRLLRLQPGAEDWTPADPAPPHQLASAGGGLEGR